MPFTDNFTDTAGTNLESHTPSGGTAWTRVDGTAGDGKIASNAMSPRMAAGNCLYQCDDQGSADHYVQFTITDGAENTSFVCNRATDNQNWIGTRVRDDGSGRKLELYKRTTAGGFTQLGADGATTVVNGDTIRLESSGDTHTVKLNGVAEITQTDSTHNTVTRQGICIRLDYGAGNPWIDNFEAGTLAAGDPEGSLISGKLLRGGLLLHGVLGR